jgi:NADPH:quinone reductase-like Zn-dependent oxidoreductase
MGRLDKVRNKCHFIGQRVTEFRQGDEVFGVTNPSFTGANADYALASAGMIAGKPRKLGYIEAASMPAVAVTAWQMLFDHAHLAPGPARSRQMSLPSYSLTKRKRRTRCWRGMRSRPRGKIVLRTGA